ncbi:TIR domain-containing protein [Methanobrevibacter sp.]|uniref:TIR domain-containing protein n=1 Tax=Methanobrevibacter sp. TaxID=66852 RepID=UPI0038709CD2
MAHEVFISYKSENAEYADALHKKLEENGIKCWLDSNDIRTAKNFAQEIIDGLNEAKVVVLIYSKEADKSPYVYREIETAFDANKHIVPLKIDNTFPEELEFFLRGTQWLDASPDNLEKRNRTLEDCYDEVVETVKEVKDIPVVPREPIENKVVPQGNPGFFEKYGKYLIVAVILVVVVGGFMAYNGMSGESGGDNLNESLVDIGYVGLQDNGGGSYSYYVYGTLSESSNISSKDIVHIDFYDKNGKVVDSSDSNISDANGNILGSVDVSSKDIAKVSLQLKDNDKVLFSQESDNIVSE